MIGDKQKNFGKFICSACSKDFAIVSDDREIKPVHCPYCGSKDVEFTKYFFAAGAIVTK